MKKKGAAIAAGITVFLFAAGAVYTLLGSGRVERKTWEYLADEGYAQQDIQSVKVRHSFLNILLRYHEWTAEVVYADEPTSLYYYYPKDGGMAAGGVSGTTEKENLKHG
jgi:hypothetical protein